MSAPSRWRPWTSGHQVTVASPRHTTFARRITEAGGEWQEVSLDRSLVSAPGAARQLRRIMFGQDVVHLHSSVAGVLGRAALPRGHNAPACLFTPNGWSWLAVGPLSRAFCVLERGLGRRSDAIVAVSSDERAVGVRVLGPSIAPRIRLIRNGIDPSAFTRDGPAAERLPAPLILCVGRLTRQKGQDVAIRALAELREREARLRLVGVGEEEGRLRELARAIGVQSRVEFAGATGNPSPQYRAADVVVVPSRWDGLSFALLEALACGRPVVAARVSGISDLEAIVESVAPDDAVAMAESIDRLLQDQTRREELGRLGPAVVSRKFNIATTVDQTLDLAHMLAAAR